ncbi:hypothetical protein HNR01_002566 [Methylorubrum rhodesianum]|jgi:hypothetical protein|nr:hypothetical protein [Methylorubrum rhodesianum]
MGFHPNLRVYTRSTATDPLRHGAAKNGCPDLRAERYRDTDAA